MATRSVKLQTRTTPASARRIRAAAKKIGLPFSECSEIVLLEWAEHVLHGVDKPRNGRSAKSGEGLTLDGVARGVAANLQGR